MVPHHDLHCLVKSDKLLQSLTRSHKQLQTETGFLISESYLGPDSPWNWTKMCLLRLKSRGNDILQPHRTLEGSWWLLHCPRTFDQNMESSKCHSDTCKSVSEALSFESVNPQYDEGLFIESPEKYKFRTCCEQKLFFCFCFDNICTQHV